MTEVIKDEQGELLFGTKEWSDLSGNILKGCSHNCKYCYAKEISIRFKRSTPETWKDEVLNAINLNKEFRSGRNKIIMFPTTHDITPQYLPESLIFIRKLVSSFEKVLIVSKPHLECIQAICTEFNDVKSKIILRFSIGSLNNIVLKFWEPNAPSFDERFKSLKYAYHHGFETSVSCEPMLDHDMTQVVNYLIPYITESIWLGKLNSPIRRLKINGAMDIEMNQILEDLFLTQTDEKIWDLYNQYKDNPKVKWKESIKKIIQN